MVVKSPIRLEKLCLDMVVTNSFLESKLFESFPNGRPIYRALYLHINAEFVHRLKHFKNLEGFKKWFVDFILQNVDVKDEKVYIGVIKAKKKILSFKHIYNLSADVLEILKEIEQSSREIRRPIRTSRGFPLEIFRLPN